VGKSSMTQKMSEASNQAMSGGAKAQQNSASL
jgi:hypothetical protein